MYAVVTHWRGFLVTVLVTGCGRLGFDPTTGDSTTARCTNHALAAAVEYPTSPNPNSVAIGDIDGDGLADLVVASSSTNTASVLRNAGNGAFLPRQDQPTGNAPNEVVVTDLNHDLRTDIATVNLLGSSVTVLINNGDGSFTRSDLGLPNTGAGLLSGDIDGDGDVDLVVRMFAADFRVFRNNGNGVFDGGTTVSSNGQPGSFALGDLDGVNGIDIVASILSVDTLAVLRNTGAGTFQAPVTFPTDTTANIALGDLNGDGALDVVAGNYTDSNLSVFLNVGSGQLAPKVDYPAGKNPTAAAIADIDGDGKQDVILANGGNPNDTAADDNTLSVFPGNGDGTVGPRQDHATNLNPLTMAVGDLDGDQRLDLVAANNQSSTVSVILDRCLSD